MSPDTSKPFIYFGEAGAFTNGQLLAFYNSNPQIQGEIQKLLDQYPTMLIYQNAPWADAETQAMFENMVINLLNKGEWLADRLEIYYQSFQNIYYMAILTKAAKKIYDWILITWPVLSGNYRNKIIESCQLGMMEDSFYVTWDASAVLNSSGINYAQYVERRKPVMAMARVQFQQYLDEAVMEVAAAM